MVLLSHKITMNSKVKYIDDAYCAIHRISHNHEPEECPATQYFFSCIVNRSGTFCPEFNAMQPQYEKRAEKMLRQVWHSYWTIMPALYYFAIGHIVAQQFLSSDGSYRSAIWRFFLEFLIITLPTVMCLNVVNSFVEYIVLSLTMVMCLAIWRSRCLQRIWECREFDLGGSRPHMLTLARTTINFLTSVCILAIDFESFPNDFRKSRRFGAALMDTGIGLFAFAMGSVSRRLHSASSFMLLLRAVFPMLLLGLARTIIIIVINYHQDEHEYGVHWNAFFTLGFAKLIGAILSAVVNTNMQLLLLGLGVLSLHELGLQYGISEFVMDKMLKRNTFVLANREGICSLPGFVGIYLVSMFIGQCLQTRGTISCKELLLKFRSMAMVSAGIWMFVLISLPIVGIARVTCNIGYAAWVFAIALTMTTLYMFVFDIVLHTILPASVNCLAVRNDAEIQVLSKYGSTNSIKLEPKLPIIVEAINYNSLLYFLLANLLTGAVNIFLRPQDQSIVGCVLILVIYKLISTGVVFVLYLFKVRIA